MEQDARYFTGLNHVLKLNSHSVVEALEDMVLDFLTQLNQSIGEQSDDDSDNDTAHRKKQISLKIADRSKVTADG